MGPVLTLDLGLESYIYNPSKPLQMIDIHSGHDYIEEAVPFSG